MRRFVIDSGGTARLIRRRFVIDAGGTARRIRRRFVIDSGGVARLVYSASYLETSITVGFDGLTSYGFNSGAYGAIASDTYTDGAPASRQILRVSWDGTNVTYTLNGAGVPNSDATFASIDLAGTVLARSAATYNGAALGGTASLWFWADAFMDTVGPVALTVNA